MFPLWTDKWQLSTAFKRPSPKHTEYIPGFAQSDFSPYSKNSSSIKGTSLSVSCARKVKGSMTVEAAVVLPLFLFFFLQLGSAIEMIRLHGNLQLALWEVGNRLSVYGHVLEDGDVMVPDSLLTELAGVALSYTYVKGEIIDYLGERYLESSPLSSGSSSLQFLESDFRTEEDTFELTVTYSVSPLGGLAAFKPFRMANKYYGRLWTGYEISVCEPPEEDYVFVAENGEVYHADSQCTHLKLSIKEVSLAEALVSRNDQGEKYEACQLCCGEVSSGEMYITSQGDCYHSLGECSGLKRTVKRMTVTEAMDYRPCSRCSGSE